MTQFATFHTSDIKKCLNVRHPCLHGLGEAEGSTRPGGSGGGLGKEAALGAAERRPPKHGSEEWTLVTEI